jgi:hypothetical protein
MTTTVTSNFSKPQRIRAPRLAIVPIAIAAAALTLTAPAASALPISNLQNECRQANGTWQVEYGTSSTGLRYVTGYQCWYRDNEGNGYVDFYDRKGNYRNTG